MRAPSLLEEHLLIVGHGTAGTGCDRQGLAGPLAADVVPLRRVFESVSQGIEHGLGESDPSSLVIYCGHNRGGSAQYSCVNTELAGVESKQAVKKRSSAVIAIALLAVVLGLTLDLTRWNAHCAPSRCHWMARSGAVVVVCGTYLAFRSASVLITLTGDLVLRTNPKPSFQYGRLAFFLITGGTLLWCFGDLIT
jgi:hypothetical protein